MTIQTRLDDSLFHDSDRHCPFLPPDAEDGAIRARLFASGDVAEAFVRRRRDRTGALHRLAYVVARRAGQALVWPEGAEPDLTLVPVSRLPRDAKGAVDLAALARLPVVSDAVLAQARVIAGASVQRGLLADLPVPDLAWRAADAKAPSPIGSGRLALLEGTPLPKDRGAQTLTDILGRAAQEAPDHGIAFVSRSGAGGDAAFLSYPQLRAAALQIAGGLLALGLKPGQPVLTVFPEIEDRAALCAIWGVIHAGMVPVPLQRSRDLLPDEPLTRRLCDAAELLADAPLICDDNAAGIIGAWLPGRQILPLYDLALTGDALPAPVAVDRAAAAMFFLTSGSTAKPKIVHQTHHSILSQVQGSCLQHGMTRQDISLNWLPLDHVGSFIMLHLRDMYVGARQIRAVGADVLRDPLIWLDWLSAYRVTSGWAPNFAFELIVSELEAHPKRGPWDLSALRFLLNGGEAVIRSTMRSFVQALLPHGAPRTVVRPAWGMSETCSGVVHDITFDPLSGRAEGPVSVGCPIPGARLRIADPGAPERVLQEGETGLLQVSGETVLTGYYQNPDQTRAAFTADGWFDTGDLGRIEGGTLSITGRKKDVLIVNGLNINPGDVEARLALVDGVRPASTAVLAFGADQGEADRIAVFFVPEAAEAPMAPLVAALRMVMAAELGLPVDVIVALDEADMPRTSIGKIQKEILRKALRSGALTPIYEAPRAGGGDGPLALWQDALFPRQAEPLPPDSLSLARIGQVALCGPQAALWRGLLADLGLPADELSVAALTGRELALTQADVLVVLPDAVADVAGALGLVQGVLRLCRQGRLRLIWLAPASDQPQNAMLGALLRSAEAEAEALSIRLVDPGTEGVTPDLLRAEILDPSLAREVVWQNGQRHERLLAPLTAAQGPGISLRQGARYLVTGGLGGVGQALCRHLQDRWGAELVILSRRAEADLAPKDAAALAQLRLRGAVIWHQADLTDPGACTGLDHLGAEGVFHLAGATDPGPLDHATFTTLEALLAVKAQATAALCNLARQPEGPWLVNFASLNGTFGGAGYGLYAMANRAQQRLAGPEDAGRIVSVAWSMWQDLGLAAGFGDTTLVRRRGYEVLTPDRALAALEPALASGVVSVHLGIDASRPAMAADLRLPEAGLAQLVVPPGTALPLDAFGLPVPGVEAAPTPNVMSESEANPVVVALCGIWQQVLRLANPPDPSDDIFQLGATSLDLPRAMGRIGDLLGREIDVLDVFALPGIAEFAAFIMGDEEEGEQSQPG